MACFWYTSLHGETTRSCQLPSQNSTFYHTLLEGQRKYTSLSTTQEGTQTVPKYLKEPEGASVQAESSHSCIKFNEATPIPKRWQENILTCHRCKRGVVSFLAKITSVKACAQHSHLSLLEVLKVHSKMKPSQCNYTASPGQIQSYAAMPKMRTPGSGYMLYIQQVWISWLCHLIQMCII